MKHFREKSPSNQKPINKEKLVKAVENIADENSNNFNDVVDITDDPVINPLDYEEDEYDEEDEANIILQQKKRKLRLRKSKDY